MIRDAASQRQVDAADPRQSTWLSANAGSGKTRVLTDRVARLLLEEVSPQNILCLTYTKAAASEMQNRLFARLGQWAMMEDDALRDELRALGVDRTINGDKLRDARRLFARAIETPGGLKIQTIHSFCAGVLRRFPLEAGVSPQFREMEDRAAELLRTQVVDQMVAGQDAHLLHDLLVHFTGNELGKLTAEIASKRGFFEHPFDEAALRDVLDLHAGLTQETLLAHTLSDIDLANVKALRDICRKGSSNDVKAAIKLDKLTSSDQPDADDLALLETVLLTGEKSKIPFGAKIGSFPTKALRENHPALMTEIEALMIRVQDARVDRLALAALTRTQAIHAFGAAFVPAYEARKLSLGMLDFDDLIGKARALLTDRDVAQWVLFRLDGGIDHVLVDEAQDTSPAQWAVIERLTQEFSVGEGAQPDRTRTVFIVGDKKQSIYSFQGADPVAFDQMKDHFQGALRDAGKRLEVLPLDYSFRSSQAILSVVDNTFVHDRSTGMDDGISHRAFKENMPGRVDLWPVIEKSDHKDDRDWFDPVDVPSATDHNVLMAKRVADQISRMINHETIPEEIEKTGTYQRRPITEGDILILVQRRSELFAETIRACKSAGLKIAGADRLRVGAELAVKDLAALLRFLALPEDDLSLAVALRSPLFGWSEQGIYTLAHHRPGKSVLWSALRIGDYPGTLRTLGDLRDKADFLRPYDLIERILTRHDGRRNLLARLGPEAEDGIDALLSQALAYESNGVPSLTGFLTWMETDDLEIKRQMDSQGGRIRVMTVHGAKGLEAPVVILPDTAQRRIDVKAELLPAGDHLIWKTPTKDSAPAVTALRDQVIERQTQERLRLLYVAMTRAEKWLIVGAAGDVGEGDASWYNIVADGMGHTGDGNVEIDDMTVRRVAHLDWNALPLTEKAVDPPVEITLPDFGPVPTVTAQKTRSPSDLGGAKALPGDPAGDDLDAALKRGTQIHLLLEHLPGVAPDQRRTLGLQLMQSSDDPPADPDLLVTEVIALLDEPNLQHLWGEDALAEVAISADILGLGRIHGAIDRLIITPERVLAVDYKSNRLVPGVASKTPDGLLRQMAAYRAALVQIYPDRAVETAILWTQNAKLMTIPDELLHEALNSVTVA